MTQTSPSKTCTKCLRVLSEGDFYRHGARRGHRPMAECKDCFRARVKRRWRGYRKTSVENRRNLRHKRKEQGHDQYFIDLICSGDDSDKYVSVHLVTREMIELKRLQVALRKYAKEHK